jgi:hypothetical protein
VAILKFVRSFFFLFFFFLYRHLSLQKEKKKSRNSDRWQMERRVVLIERKHMLLPLLLLPKCPLIWSGRATRWDGSMADDGWRTSHHPCVPRKWCCAVDPKKKREPTAHSPDLPQLRLNTWLASKLTDVKKIWLVVLWLACVHTLVARRDAQEWGSFAEKGGMLERKPTRIGVWRFSSRWYGDDRLFVGSWSFVRSKALADDDFRGRRRGGFWLRADRGLL